MVRLIVRTMDFRVLESITVYAQLGGFQKRPGKWWSRIRLFICIIGRLQTFYILISAHPSLSGFLRWSLILATQMSTPTPRLNTSRPSWSGGTTYGVSRGTSGAPNVESSGRKLPHSSRAGTDGDVNLAVVQLEQAWWKLFFAFKLSSRIVISNPYLGFPPRCGSKRI